MIVVTRLNGPPFAVNPDLLERVESTPDTVLTLIDGTKFLVQESVTDVVALVRDYRASVVATARDLGRSPAAEIAADEEPTIPGPRSADERPHLTPVSSLTERLASRASAQNPTATPTSEEEN
ncbi:flagellar protein FlbD [Quadrisphaera granulorum]|uniref:Flagellar protein FlbD n=1 Tax=Quadrisphaera granulorum TaxID=317664 RepID=A0A316A3N5_9ACTN|nr:flagellar FlbD family protein [Quadrisphaera granulorum]PWJ52586.1 flagellar protein FlbD [Quadrisphaera granulorum]SZE97636.1 flagellar protein FlbD [Quadrisphaera granulorum]